MWLNLYVINKNDMHPLRYTTYEYDDDSAPHSSRDYYESSDYPGKLLYLLHHIKFKKIFTF